MNKRRSREGREQLRSTRKNNPRILQHEADQCRPRTENRRSDYYQRVIFFYTLSPYFIHVHIAVSVIFTYHSCILAFTCTRSVYTYAQPRTFVRLLHFIYCPHDHHPPTAIVQLGSLATRTKSNENASYGDIGCRCLVLIVGGVLRIFS